MNTIKEASHCLVGSPHRVAVWLRITSLSEIVDPAVLAPGRRRRARVPAAKQQLLPVINVLPVIVRRRRDLVHHSLQFVMVVLRRVYRVRMQRVEVVCLVSCRVQLAV